MTELSEHHKEQLAAFLRFAEYKRGEHSNEVEGTFEDFKDSRVVEDVYTKEDVEAMLDDVCQGVKGTLGTELQHYSHTHMLVLQQLFKQGETLDLNFSIDASQLESGSALSDLQAFEGAEKEKAAMSSGLSDKKGLATISAAGGAGGAGNHLDMLRRVQGLEKENAEHKERYAKLQAAVSEQMREKSEGGGRALAAAEGRAHMSGVEMEQKIEQLSTELEQAKEEVSITNGALEAKVDKSKQFQSLKKIIGTKNEQVKDLRVRLAKYENVHGDIKASAD